MRATECPPCWPAPACMVDDHCPKPQATTSVQLGCSAAQGKCVIYTTTTIILAPPQPMGERASSAPPKRQGLTSDQPFHQAAANHSSSSAAAADQGGTSMGNNSRQWVKTKKRPLSGKRPGADAMLTAQSPKPSKTEPETSKPARQLLTQNPLETARLFRWSSFPSEMDRARGD